jgi:hypothetical protein
MKTEKDIIEFLYKNDGLRNTYFLNTIIPEDFTLEWYSSYGLGLLNKKAILNLAQELKQNFIESVFEISHFVHENDTFVVKYIHKVTSIENPKEYVLLAKMVPIWDFKDRKLHKGYQISKPN